MEARMSYPSLSSVPATTLIDVLAAHSRNRPHALAYTFLVDGEAVGLQLTYGALDRRARAIGATLQQLGAIGERVMLLYPSGLEYIAAYMGCLYAGSVAVPMALPHRKRSGERLQTVVADAQAAFALTTEALVPQVTQWRAHTPGLQPLHWLATDTIDEAMEAAWNSPRVGPDSLAFLQYTSGSTSAPKGVMVSHGNLMHNQRILQQACEHSAETVCVSWLPLYHDLGLIGKVLHSLYVGGHCVLMTPTAFLQRPVRWLQAISAFKAHYSAGPNFAYDLCVQKITAEQRQALNLSSWNLALSGAEPIRSETLNRFAETFASCGFRAETLYPAYGLAEATLLVTGGRKAARPIVQAVQKTALSHHRVIPAQADDADAQTLVGCGQTRLEQQLRIVDPATCQSCAPGQVGEVWVAGPSVAQGYWNNSAASAQTFQAHVNDAGAHADEGPFLRTGDLGYLCGDELFVTGRIKDMMIIRGSNHYPQDIEETMEQSHAALRPGYGAAFSIEVEGEERLVVVQELTRSHRSALSATCDLREVSTAIRQAISEAHGLQVHAILLLRTGSVPKTTSGKIQRQACKVGFLTRSLNVMSAWHATPTPNRHARMLPTPARILPLSVVVRDRRQAQVRHTIAAAACHSVARAA
jgi:acyl-CoA synthetase (AMP-forming)/AMP-acid ligase II